MSETPPASNVRHRGRPAKARTELLRRGDILERAHALVDEHGLDGLSMRKLADVLGVTPAAIYHYFPNKRALLYAMVDDVYGLVLQQFPAEFTSPDDWIIQWAIAARRVWLEHLALVNLSMAVARADANLINTTYFLTVTLEAAGFPDVPLAASALQNFIIGSISTWANRHVSSAYFGLDPDHELAEAEQLLDERDASANHRGVLAARFDAADEAHFEPALRALLQGLRTVQPDGSIHS